MSRNREKNSDFDRAPIPAGWTEKRIFELSDVVRGGSPRPAGSPKYFNGNYIPWITVAEITNIPDSEIYIKSSESYLTEEGSKQSRILEKGTLLLANSGATLGVPKILKIKACANDGVAAFQNLNNKYCDKLFLYYFLQSKTKYYREVVAPGNGQPNLNTTLIGETLVLLPSLSEQKKIVEILSFWDKSIETVEKLLAKKEEQKKGLMQILLTGKKRFKEFKGEKWKTMELGEVFSFLSTASLSREQLTNEVRKDSVFYIHYGDIHATYSGPYLDFSNGQNIPTIISGVSVSASIDFLNNGDLIVADASEDYEGVAACIEIKNVGKKKVIGGLHTFALRDKGFIVEGLRAFILKHPEVARELKKLATGSNVYGLSKTNMQKVKLYVPSKKEQVKIASVLSKSNEEIEHLNKQLKVLREKKKGLIQVLLTGKKRVRI